MSWYEDSIMYQIYPLGFCDAPKENDDLEEHRIKKVVNWIPHFKMLGITSVMFNPVFESDRHGYDTRDYKEIDCRLGTNQDFKEVCNALHENGIKVILDGVFNHVGRGFWAFQDVLQKKEQSEYVSWFHIRFYDNNSYQDGFWYEGWEGHYELVKLNLKNNDVVEYLLDCIKEWITQFEIDGLRLDVAYCLDPEFLKRLKKAVTKYKKDFVLIGEVLFGDYKLFVNEEMLDSCTNYECYKGLYSSFNDLNLFEISHSLNRQFGPDRYTLYKGKHLLAFLDNHDVTRISSMLKEKKHLKALYGLLYTMPGVPCIYYGSEWGEEGNKSEGDNALRPSFQEPKQNDLTQWIQKLSEIYKEEKALRYGGYENITIRNKQLLFVRKYESEMICVAINAEGSHARIPVGICAGEVIDLLSQEEAMLQGEVELLPYGFSMWKKRD